MIEQNLKEVQEKIRQACIRSGRTMNEVTLIAVSKTKPIEDIQEVYQCGIIHFGENKVQELADKYDNLHHDIQWHMIGHLQRNKVKYIIDKVSLIHSVDSIRLAEQIQEEARKKNVIVDILVQVNVAMETSKFGLEYDETLELIKKISQLHHIRIKGLMTIAPFVESPEENREIFKKLHKLKLDIKKENIDNVNMDILSMGMTNDYEVAIEEGATMVRVGTGIFGTRKYI